MFVLGSDGKMNPSATPLFGVSVSDVWLRELDVCSLSLSCIGVDWYRWNSCGACEEEASPMFVSISLSFN